MPLNKKELAGMARTLQGLSKQYDCSDRHGYPTRDAALAWQVLRDVQRSIGQSLAVNNESFDQDGFKMMCNIPEY